MLLTGCPYKIDENFRENRIELIKTNIIGIAGEYSSEPYIEIQYSMADEEKSEYNKTVNIMVSPPYVFKNDKVYMTYEYVEYKDRRGPLQYHKTLLRDFEEGGAEYLRIINHSPDKEVEFFVAGTQTGKWPNNEYRIPSVRYKKAPVYFLLFPEYKYTENVIMHDGNICYFVDDRCGDLILTEPWTIDAITALYRAEYARSNEVNLIIDIFSLTFQHRMIDLVEGKVAGWESYRDNIFYGVIEPEKELRGNKKIWLLSTPSWMFNNEFEKGSLR